MQGNADWHRPWERHHLIRPARAVDGVEVGAVAARDRARAEAFAARHGGATRAMLSLDDSSSADFARHRSINLLELAGSASSEMGT
jgi:predicted dehydrogenase